ncbi:MAG: phenylalanine--tRNA ligase subunit beta [Nanoarchaeota archaeon]|nr:phenylalanine--tRNA ligase subunit beta [Nanoarchaeota archaeon]MBU1322350.1 phenylalanine--tRNA ligase subunit beta [Nanoarchaeota archaeon]MBU1598208.1 phenylalanine--tRNA ligase subunit beta [Nanoarchaeota archaeon]MBU2440973.1 phenylalanine--tRNA ligase subunit beta [Nanoarchaeota archaeon]
MPTVTLNKEVLEKLVGKKLPLEELKDRISMLGTDLEKIEGNEIIVEVFPNRPDMLSEQGFARALSSFIGVKTGLRKYKVNKAEKDYKVIIEAPVKKVRPFTACAIVKNLKFDDEKIREIIQIQEKLHVSMGRNRKKLAIGIYPLEDITLPITYTAKKPKDIKFIPLESDKEMDGLQILQKHPTGREYAHLLEGKEVYPIFIDAKNNILSMPPIINSHKTGKISEKTKDVFIEFSGFDYDVLSKGLNILVTALADMGGEIYEMQIEDEKEKKKTTSPDLSPIEWKLDIKYVNKMLGLDLSESEIKKLLEKMGYDYDSKNKKVLVPAYRTDILHQIDFAEDIAIAYGYENFEPEIPNVSTIGETDKFEEFKSRVANILVGLGLIETNTYHITNKEDHNKKMCYEAEAIELKNALTKDYSLLRSWILPGSIKVLSENTNKEYPQNIFDMGTIFRIKKEEETGVKEFCRVAVTLCNKDANYTCIKQVFDALMDALDIKYDIKVAEHSSFIKGRLGRVSIKNIGLAYIGEINPQVLENFGIEMPIAAFELNLTELYNIMKI